MDAPVFDRQREGEQLIARAEALGRHSDSAENYTRVFLSPAHQAAAKQLAAWMREAGMTVRVDAIGNVIGHYEAKARDGPAKDPNPGPPLVLIGSHFDSVRNGGKYDGVLGILVGIAAVAELSRRGERRPFAIEVVGFSDEEGARFQTSFLSSRALLGRLEPGVMEKRDADGISFPDALRAAGLDPARLGDPGVDVARLAAYVEVHIEQGPVLLDAGAPLGVVTSIAGGARHRVRVRGEAGHAGTVPMKRRRDALAAACEMALAVERRCGAGGSLVGTVGILNVKDGTGNVIPGEVEFTTDIRAGDDATRLAAVGDVQAAFEEIARRRGVSIESRELSHNVRAVPCSLRLQDQLARSVERVTGAPAMRLPSGAGHDAMILAEVTEAAMLFVRCGAGGVSHNPAETASAEDAGLACAALVDCLRHFEPTH